MTMWMANGTVKPGAEDGLKEVIETIGKWFEMVPEILSIRGKNA